MGLFGFFLVNNLQTGMVHPVFIKVTGITEIKLLMAARGSEGCDRAESFNYKKYPHNNNNNKLSSQKLNIIIVPELGTFKRDLEDKLTHRSWVCVKSLLGLCVKEVMETKDKSFAEEEKKFRGKYFRNNKLPVLSRESHNWDLRQVFCHSS